MTIAETTRKLFAPLRVKGLTLRNRIVMPPMVMNYAAADGSLTDQGVAYYAARANGGAALVIVEAASVVDKATRFTNGVGAFDDRFIPGLRRLAGAVHAGGALVGIQLFHAGKRASPTVTGQQPVSASPIAGVDRLTPRELSTAEIGELVVAWGAAAARAREAGFDMVEIHMAHSYLLNQFLSPTTNHRADAYGGSFENRLRFPLEVVAEVRRRVGQAVPLIARLSADEYLEGGLRLADSQDIARRLEAAGIDVLSVSGGGAESPLMGPTGQKKSVAKSSPGYFTHLAQGIKSAVGVPVIGAGRLHDPAYAAQVVAEGKADLIAVGRALLTDPEWPNKVAAGDSARIQRCTCCGGCSLWINRQQPVRCKQNRNLGLEYLA